MLKAAEAVMGDADEDFSKLENVKRRLERWKVLAVMVSFSVFCVGWCRRRGEQRESVGQRSRNG
jgi:hypothetical protein